MKKPIWIALVFMMVLPSVIVFAAAEAESTADFPTKPIHLVVYLAPGGAGDILARRFTDIATKYTDATFVVENKPGSGGIVALEYGRAQPSDGYTLMYMTKSVISGLASNASDIDPMEFDWIAQVQVDPEAVITNVNSPIHTWEQIAADARAKGGRQLWLGPAVGGLDHVTAQAIWAAAGIDATWVPYDSGGAAIAGLLGEQGIVYVGNPGETLGKPDLMVAAVAYSERLPQFPDVPTFSELGVTGVENEVIWRGFAIKAGTPDNVVAWYEDLFEKVSTDPEWIAAYAPQGVQTVNLTREKFNPLVAADYAAYLEAVANR